MHNLEFVLQQMQPAHMALTSYGTNDFVANSRKNPLEARSRLQKRCDPTTGGGVRNLLRTIISPGRCPLFGPPSRDRMTRLKKLKDMLDDEIKLAGLEALVLEELEKHLTLNPSIWTQKSKSSTSTPKTNLPTF